METRELPVLFRTPLVEKILAGSKTQTRRPVRSSVALVTADDLVAVTDQIGPLGRVGDRLWVRETWQALVLKSAWNDFGDRMPPEYDEWWEPVETRDLDEERKKNSSFSLLYRAGADEATLMEIEPYGWRPSLHMYRWACRLVLEVTDIRVERLQQLSAEDAFDEGIEPVMCCAGYYPQTGDGCGCMGLPVEDPRHEFADSWDRTYAKKRAGWAENPWVWAATFKVVEKPEPPPVMTDEEKEQFDQEFREKVRLHFKKERGDG